MPYKEYGTPQDFSGSQIIDPAMYVITGMHGIYGLQSHEGTTAVNIDSISLQAIALKLQQSGKVSVDYIRLSWNQSDSTVTDLVLGILWHVLSPTNVNDLWNYLPTDIRQVITDLHMLEYPDFTVYLVNGLKQTDNTYSWVWKGETPENIIYTPPPTDDQAKADVVADNKIDKALDALKAKAESEGFLISIRSYEVLTAHCEALFYQPPVPPYYREAWKVKTTVEIRVDFDSDKPIGGSITLGIILSIAIAISLLIVAYAIYNYLDKLATTKSEVTTRITNPNDYPVTVTIGGKEYTIPAHGTLEVTETTEGGNPWAQLPLIILGIGVLVVVVLLFTGRRKQ
jgi:hypothetical protein